MQNAARNLGFTLIELLMTVAIVAILVAIAAPAYGKLLGRTQGATARGALEAALNQARIAAVGRGAHVVVCPSADGERCERTTQWQRGWIVFADSNLDGARSTDEPLLGVMQALPEGVAILSSAGRLRVGYLPDGAASGTNLTLTICDRIAGAADARTLIVSQSGRVRHAAAAPDAAAACLRVAG
jgi:type IV fimbrial biogenesis protein FimT